MLVSCCKFLTHAISASKQESEMLIRWSAARRDFESVVEGCWAC